MRSASESGGGGGGHADGGAQLKDFIWRVIDFSVLAGIIIWALIKQNVKGGLKARQDEIERTLRDAAEARDAAELKLKEYTAKLEQANREIDEISATIRHEAELEKSRIVAEAAVMATKIQEQARQAGRPGGPEGPRRTPRGGCPPRRRTCREEDQGTHHEERSGPTGRRLSYQGGAATLITNAIARRYAKALVQLAVEEGRVEQIQEELAGFEAVLAAGNDLTAIFTSPAYGIDAKRAIMKDVTARLKLDATVVNFLLLLLDRGRIGFLSQINAAYGAYADDISGVVRPTLISALPLEAAQVQAIKDALTTSTGKKVMLTVEVDPSLIGGVVTKIGDMVYDGSIKTQLNKIEGILQKG